MKSGIVFLCLTAAAAVAQPGAVIKTETRVVLVDTIVTDKQGDYVHGLAVKDFRLLEDNKEQKIQSLSLEKGVTGSRPHNVVVFFAPMDAAGRAIARQAVSGFIDASVGAGDNRRIAVVSYTAGLKIGQNFTDDAGHLKAAVDRATSTEAETSSQSAAAIETTRALGNLARSLGVLEGRKTIVLVTEGLAQSSSQRAELAATIEACNKSDVAVYPIDVRPLAVTGIQDGFDVPFSDSDNGHMMERMARRGTPTQKDLDNAVSDAGVTNQQALFRLAGGTGGFVIPSAGELQKGLQRIGQEQREYYVLSFTPGESPNETKAGSCHTLRVKVDRGGTTVRARTNYCESKPQDLLAGTIAGEDLERRSATAESNTNASMQLSWFYVSAGVARVSLAMEIAADAMKVPAVKGKQSKPALNLLGIATNKDGEVAARFSDAVKLDSEAQGKPLRYEKEFRLAPGQYTFTMAFSSGGESFGKLETPLIVEPRQPGDLAVSGLALSRETHPAAALGLDISALTESNTPLVVNDVEVVPSGSNRFRKTENVTVYFEVYTRNAGGVRAEMRVTQRQGQTTKDDHLPHGSIALSAPKGGSDTIPVAIALPIAGFDPGAYTLAVSATDAAGKQVTRTADFEVY